MPVITISLCNTPWQGKMAINKCAGVRPDCVNGRRNIQLKIKYHDNFTKKQIIYG